MEYVGESLRYAAPHEFRVGGRIVSALSGVALPDYIGLVARAAK